MKCKVKGWIWQDKLVRTLVGNPHPPALAFSGGVMRTELRLSGDSLWVYPKFRLHGRHFFRRGDRTFGVLASDDVGQVGSQLQAHQVITNELGGGRPLRSSSFSFQDQTINLKATVSGTACLSDTRSARTCQRATSNLRAMRLGVSQALRGFVTGPAYAPGLEADLGSLAPGKLADLVVLPRDPFAGDAEELRELRPCAVMVGGAWQWCAF